MKRTVALLIAAVIVVNGCGEEPGTTDPNPNPQGATPVVTTVTVSPASVTLDALGATQQLAAAVADQNGNAMSGTTVTWSSATEGVATVSTSGLVAGVANGTATITATTSGVSGTAAVTVSQEAVTVALDPASVTLSIAETVQLTGTASDANGNVISGKMFTWSSSDESVATVDASGLLTAAALGSATISATADGVSGSATVTVAQVATTVEVTPASATLVSFGDTVQLGAKASDADGNEIAGKVLTWASSDESVITVSASGQVTAVANGSVTITASTDGVSGSATVTVAQVATTVEVIPASATLASFGETVQFGATASDANSNVISGRTFTWTSSDESIATVSQSGLVTPVANGATTITATTEGTAGTAVVTVLVPGPAITNTTLSGGTVGQSYSQTVAATGGMTPYVWSISAGTLPAGLVINASTGVISGTPTSAGTSSFTVMVTDANSLSDTQELSITNGSGGSQEQIFELIDGLNITMVWIPPGEFDMGSPADETDRSSAEGPVHTVTIGSGFWMSKYEVTQGQWEAVMGTNPARRTGGVGASYPVYSVSWNDIQGFLGQTTSGFRLPSEAEWEYAARAGTQTRFYWGDDPGYTAIGDYAVYSLNDPNGPAEVGTKQPNAWGLHDMSGNMWELVEDDHHSSYSGAPSDGSAWTDDPRATSRVIRGGTWGGGARYCRSALRGWIPQSIGGSGYGFRLVLVP